MPHVLITGAADGIGKALAHEFAKAKNTCLSLVDINGDGLAAVAVALSSETQYITANLGDPKAVEGLLSEAENGFGPVDVLINNAGIMRVGRMHQMDIKTADLMLQLDLLTPLRLTHYALTSMLERKQGVVVNVASMAGITVTPGCAYYGAVKAGLGHATESLKIELKDTGVSAISVYPGPVETALEKGARAEIEESFATKVLPVGKPATLAKLIRKAVERGESDKIIYPAAYGIAAEIPGLINRGLSRISPQPKH